MIRIVGIPFGHTVGHIILQTQSSQAVFCQIHAALEFLFQLFGHQHQMSFGNGELAYTGQTVHFTGVLVAEQSGGFTHTIGQVAVGLGSCLVYIVLERTGHGTKGKYFFILFLIAQHEHAFLVVSPVIGNHIQIALCHQRSAGSHITALLFLVLNPSLQSLNNLGSLGHEQRQTLAHNVNCCEQFQITAQLVMIALLDILQIIQIFLQLILLCKCGTVNSGKHFVFLAASPVSA